MSNKITVKDLSEYKVTHKIKVDINFKSGKSFFGYVYLRDDQRLQDLMNDERPFIPVDRHVRERSTKEDRYLISIVQKDSIEFMHEVDE